MSIRITQHAKERATERGLGNSDLPKFARSHPYVTQGEFELKGCVVVVRDGTIRTVLGKGMRRDSRM